MKTYTAIFEHNNGCKCSCCKETWNNPEFSDFEDDTPFGEILSYFQAFEDEECRLLCITQDGDPNSYNREGN